MPESTGVHENSVQVFPGEISSDKFSVLQHVRKPVPCASGVWVDTECTYLLVGGRVSPIPRGCFDHIVERLEGCLLDRTLCRPVLITNTRLSPYLSLWPKAQYHGQSEDRHQRQEELPARDVVEPRQEDEHRRRRGREAE